MINVKNLFDAPEPTDGLRLSVDAFGLCRDLEEWCRVDHVLNHLGPPVELSDWFEQHPDGYEFFRAKYHEHLAAGPFTPALTELAEAGVSDDFTLLHQGDDPEHNAATALYEYLAELQAYSG